VGTRYEDQPAEHWAGPESLDPTPVWKQYLLVAVLLAVGLVVILTVGIAALAPQFVTPPALVPGDRYVIAVGDFPAGNLAARLYNPEPNTNTREFWLVRTGTTYVAMAERWTPRAGAGACNIEISPVGAPGGFSAKCPDGTTYFFDPTGVPRTISAASPARPPRGLDQYLVSVSGDRLIVNLSRLITSDERTSAPVPTGIPQPQQP
jgi:hypothetical protein